MCKITDDIFHFRGFGDGACKDVTVGDCNLENEYVVQVIQLPISIEQCQFFCNSLTDCVVFQHKAESCTLLREDYRQQCKSAGGPTVISKLRFLDILGEIIF